jgi:hypothetical protein
MSEKPVEVHTRKLAILAELGIDPNIVPVDGFEDDGIRCTVLVEGKPFISGRTFLTELVAYPNPDCARRAIKARDDDFLETHGLYRDEDQ